jgi:phage recombination protein Bet
MKKDAIEVIQPGDARIARPPQISGDQVALIKRTIAEDFSDDELTMFIHQANKTGLDPLAKQIYAWKDKHGKVCIGSSIDGFRLTASRTGCYAPGRPTEYDIAPDGTLISATAYVKVLAGGEWHEVSESAYLEEFEGTQPIWRQMPRVMLSKCAEARALRRAFPAELSGVYEGAEMDHSASPKPPASKPARRGRADLTGGFGDSAPSGPQAVGKVESIDEKKGTSKAGKDWLRFDIWVCGEVHKTFSETFEARAKAAMVEDREVAVAYKVGQWGRDIVDLTLAPLNGPPPSTDASGQEPPDDEDPPPHGDDEIPF